MPIPWKQLERDAATALGGQRNSRGDDFSRSDCDVSHPLFSIECKYRKSLPKLLTEALAQAKRYNHKKVPIAVLKERGQRGAIVALSLADFQDLLGKIGGAEQ